MHYFLGMISWGKAVEMYTYTQKFNGISDVVVRGKPSRRFHQELETRARDTLRFFMIEKSCILKFITMITKISIHNI